MFKILCRLYLFILIQFIAFKSYTQYYISTYAGGGSILTGNNSKQIQFRFEYIFVTPNGDIYVPDEYHDVVRKISSSGQVTLIAGNGTMGFSGDGGASLSAQLHNPRGITIDKNQNIYVTHAPRIRQINTFGIINTIAGNGMSGNGGDGGPAISAQLISPSGLAFDSNENLYITDVNTHSVRKVDVNGIITTIAGSGVRGYGGDGTKATSAKLNFPTSIAFDNYGNVYIADEGNHCIRKIDQFGIITTIAGNGNGGFSGDGGPATLARLNSPKGLGFDDDGNLYVADSYNFRIRKIDQTGKISTIAGNGNSGYSGDGGPSANASFTYPTDVKFDGNGNMYVADGTRLRKISKNGVIETIAGTGIVGFRGDGSNALNAELNYPTSISFDSNGNTYISDRFNNRVRRITKDGIINTIAGNGIPGFSGDGGDALKAEIKLIKVITDKEDNIIISDAVENRIRKIDGKGIISTVAGSGFSGFGGDGGGATSANLNWPIGISFDTSGNLLIADQNNHRIRLVNKAGIISTIAGNGVQGYSGDGQAAILASFKLPSDVTVDRDGNIYVLDAQNYRVRKIDKLGIINTVAGNGSIGHSGDGGPATAASLNSPVGVTVDLNGNLYITEWSGNRIRKVDKNGIISTIAGNGGYGYSGDGSNATSATLSGPSGILVDSLGNIYFAESAGNRIRKLSLSQVSPAVTTQAATNVTTNAATLNGTVNAQGNATTSITIRYSTVKADVDGGSGTQATVSPASVSGSTATNITANVTGLTPSTTYYFRASATNAGGMANGSTLSFSARNTRDTPFVYTNPATNITSNSATLTGTASAMGLSVTSVFIRYTTNRMLLESGGGVSALVYPSTVNGSLYTFLRADVMGLSSNTTYYFQASATNLWSTGKGAILSFTTSSPIPAPTVLTLPATDIGLNTAVLNGSVNPNGSQSSLTTLKYSTIKADVDAGNGLSPIVNPISISGFIPTLITANLTGLQPNTTYFYRASATTPGGVRNGATLSFTTISSADILVPSAFSPNGDGQNDLLVPIPVGIKSLSYFKIINRWGQLVFETKELSKGWDGNFKGVPQPRDTYSWVIEALDVTGKTIRKSGGCLLVR